MADESPPAAPILMDAEGVARLLSVPVDTVQNQYRVGRLRGVKIGKHLRFRPADVVAFVDTLGNVGGDE